MIEEKPGNQYADANDKNSDEKRAHLVNSQPLVPRSDTQKSLGTDSASKEAASKIEEPLKKIERHTLIIAWAGLIVASITGVVFYCQLKEMGKQTKILSDQAKQAAADSIVSEGHTREQLGIAQQQANASQDSVEAIQRQMRQDQRAWLKIEVTFPPVAREGIPLISEIKITNTGKTPAKRVFFDFSVSILTNTEKVKFDYERGVLERIGILPPNSFAVMQITRPITESTTVILTREQAQDLLAGRSYMVTYGHGIHSDVFGEVHWYRFCNWKSYAPQGSFAQFNAANCMAYNDTGNGELPNQN